MTAQHIAALFDPPVEVVAARFEGTPFEPVPTPTIWGTPVTVRKIGAWLPVSIELIDDLLWPVPRRWDAEEWAVEVARLQRVRQILGRQPLAAVKAAATRDVRRAERVRRFPHTTWETPQRWHDLDDEGRPKEEAD